MVQLMKRLGCTRLRGMGRDGRNLWNNILAGLCEQLITKDMENQTVNDKYQRHAFLDYRNKADSKNSACFLLHIISQTITICCCSESVKLNQ